MVGYTRLFAVSRLERRVQIVECRTAQKFIIPQMVQSCTVYGPLAPKWKRTRPDSERIQSETRYNGRTEKARYFIRGLTNQW